MPTQPPKWLVLLSKITGGILDAIVWTVKFLPHTPKHLRRIVRQAGCYHDCKVTWWSKGCSKVFYIEQCRLCEKSFPINSVSRQAWEEMRLEKILKHRKKFVSPV